MKRSILVRIVVLFVAILMAGGYVGYRAWAAARDAETEKSKRVHFNGTKSAEILPSESVKSEPPAQPVSEETIFYGSKSAPVFKAPAKKQPPPREQQIASPSKG